MKLHSSLIRKIWWNVLTALTIFLIKLFGKKEVSESGSSLTPTYREFSNEINLNEIKKILIIRMDKVGDLILATPVFENIKKNFPDVKIDVLTGKYNKNVLHRNPDVNEVLVHSLKTLLKLEKQKYDLCLNLIYDFELKSALACYLSKAKFRLGYKSKYSSNFFNLEMERDSGSKYELDRNLDLLKFVGIKTDIDKPKLYPSDEDFDKIKRYLMENNILLGDILVGFNPGTGRRIRRWPSKKFILLGKELVKKYNVKIMVIWGKTERVIADEIVNSIGRNSFLAPQTDVLELTALISNFKVFVSGNTGPIHMAMAINVPTVGLYGKNDYQNWTPENDEKLVIVKGEKCEEIKVDEVLKGVEKFIC
ncbi:MAG: glycosyltransferase family 9 protein [Candidatus Firestonebacteria bacterium]